MGTSGPKSLVDLASDLIQKQLQKKPQSLLVLVGPTASGKTALALELAKIFPIEIISADSRLLYRGMNIGTAKPTLSEQHSCPHHMIDDIDPDQSFSAAEFQLKANAIVFDILKRKKVPLLVGGTMLYIDAIVYNYQWPQESNDQDLKKKWRSKNLEELQKIAYQMRPDIAEWVDTKNPVRLQRVLMYHESTHEWLWEKQKKAAMPDTTLMLGLCPDKEILKQRIAERVEKQWQDGLVAELKGLLNDYPIDSEGFSAIGYRQVIQFLKGNCSEEEAKAQVLKATLSYAKRQMTWWKRDKNIIWLDQMHYDK